MADNTITSASGTALRTYEDYLASQKIRTPKQELGKDDFLSLLVAQMSNQDPMEPTKDTEFVAQLAQFSSLEQINSLNNTMSMFQSYSLTGKFVYAEVVMADGTKTPVAGVVDKIITKDGKAYAQVGDIAFDVSAIVEVVDIDYALGSNPLLEHSNLIGKYVTSEYDLARVDDEGNAVLDEKGNPIIDRHTVSGYVTRISVDATDGMVAHLDTGEKLSLSLILDIRESAPAQTDDGQPDTSVDGGAAGDAEGETVGETDAEGGQTEQTDEQNP